MLKTYDPPLDALPGRRILQVRRVGKLVVLDLDGDRSLVIHLMRDGRLHVAAPRERGGRDLALGLLLDDGREVRLVERGPKKRAAAYVLRTSEMHRHEPLVGLGIDPLDPAFTGARLRAILAGESAQLKRVLTLQRHVTGIGNAYADEILWEARLSPFAPADRLTPEEAGRLHEAVVAVLRRAVAGHRARFGGALPSREPPELLRVHRRGKEPCPRCGTPIAQVAYADKETYYCPRCQTGGKVYADRRMSRLLR